MSDKTIGQSIKDSFMAMNHATPAPPTGNNNHPASNDAELTTQAGLRDHGAGNNGPNADFRAAGTAFENVRKQGENASMRASDHGVDGLKQHNAS